MEFDTWLKDGLRALPSAERSEYESRANDLFVQEICSIKLTLAIETDIRQENSRLESHRFVEEVSRMAVEQCNLIKSSILAELDLPIP
jgi:hypothetical protein